ncbi:MAG: hypothetical protein ABIK89_02295, partial [Planctomycetota bacterium]
LLLVAFEGCFCRPRHGLIVRGDFALELNRIPWLASRGDVYEESSAAALDCPAGCSAGCLEDGADALGLPMVPEVDAGACLGGRCKTGVLCRHCSNRGAGGPPPSAVAETGHSRFHPVPTRPVFLPLTDRYAAVEAETDRSKSDQTPPPRQQDEPAPLPPAMEVIPTPAPNPTNGWKPKGGSPEDTRSTGANATSFPPMELKVGKILRGPA